MRIGEDQGRVCANITLFLRLEYLIDPDRIYKFD